VRVVSFTRLLLTVSPRHEAQRTHYLIAHVDTPYFIYDPVKPYLLKDNSIRLFELALEPLESGSDLLKNLVAISHAQSSLVLCHSFAVLTGDIHN
jgi:hypothetical protein